MRMFESVLLMTPPLEQSTHREPEASGMSSTGWLKRLKIWNWNWPVTRSVIAKSFKIAPSAVNWRGPTKGLRPTLPKVPKAGRPKGLDPVPTGVEEGVKYGTVWVIGFRSPALNWKAPLPLLGRQSLLRPGPLKLL